MMPRFIRKANQAQGFADWVFSFSFSGVFLAIFGPSKRHFSVFFFFFWGGLLKQIQFFVLPSLGLDSLAVAFYIRVSMGFRVLF